MDNKAKEIKDYHEYIKDFFRKWAPYYAVIVDGVAGGLREKVVNSSGIKGKLLLDVCTGTGSQAKAFARAGNEVSGIDFSQDMLEIAAKVKIAGCNFKLADATRLPFEDKSFDAVCVSFGLHEMPLFIRDDAVAEILRVVKPKGVIVTVDYSKRRKSLLGNIQYHFIRSYESKYFSEFVETGLQGYLEAAGLVCEARFTAFLGAVEVLKFRKED